MSEQSMNVTTKRIMNSARQINNIFLGSAFGVLIIYVILTIQTNVWQLYISSVGLALLMVVFGLSRRWINNGRPVAATQLSIYSTIAAVFLNGVIMSGLGLAFAVGLVAIASQIGSLVLTNRQTTQAVAFSAAAGLIMIALDSFDLPFRFSLPLISSVISVAAIVITFVMGYLIYRNFSSYTLRGKLTIGMILVAVVAVWTIAVSVNTLARNFLQEESGDHLRTFVQAQGLAIGTTLAQQVSNLQSFSLNQTLQSSAQASNATYRGSAVAVQSELAEIDHAWIEASADDPLITDVLDNNLASELLEYRNIFPNNVELFVTDRYGALLAATNRTSDYYQADETWWQEAYNNGQGGVYISQPAFDESSGVLALKLAVPIFAHEDATEIVGVLRSTYELGALADILANARFDETGKIDLFLPGELKITLSDSNQISLQEISQSDLFAVSQAAGGAVVNTTYQDVPSRVGRAPVNTLAQMPYVDALDWIVVASQAEADGLAPVATQQRLVVFLGAIVVVLAAGSATYIGQRLTEPIVNLTETAVRVQENDLQARASVESDDEIGVLAATFNEMTDRLAQTLQTLEQRVAERTRALEISSQVSRQLSTILDQDRLVKEVVEKVQSAFDYYHVHIYLWDADENRLQMAGGTGEAGRIMLSRQHTIQLDRGLVGRAASRNLPVLVADVTQEENWLPNELLPETKSEAAVPIAVGGEVLGVLDVQQNQVNSLTQQDVELLQSVANQVAIGLQNARLISRIQQQANQEITINQIRERILSTTDMESALQVAVRELGHTLQAKKTSVVLSPAAPPTNGRSGKPEEKSA